MMWLLFAICYLAVTAWIKVFINDPTATDKAATWMLLTFSILYALTGYRIGFRGKRSCGAAQVTPHDGDAL